VAATPVKFISVPHDDSDDRGAMKGEFNREAWREGLEELDPAARAAMAKVAAEKDLPDPLDIDRVVAGLGAMQELEDRDA
jgi:hypothetical protein